MITQKIQNELVDLIGVNSLQKMTHFPNNETLSNFCYKPGTESGYSVWVYEAIASFGYVDLGDQKFIMAVCLLPEPRKEKSKSEFR